MPFLFNKIRSRFSSLDQIMVYLIYFLVIALPLIYDTRAKAVFEAPKLFLLRIITLLILFLWGLWICKEGKLILKISPIHRYLLFYAVILVLNTVFSTHIYSSLLGNQGRFLGLFTMLNFVAIFFIISHFFKDSRQIIRLIITSSVLALLIAVWAILQHQGILPTMEKWTIDPEERAFATFGHSNHFGAYLAFHFLLIAGLFMYYRSFWLRLFFFLGGLIMIGAILATASRGALFALIGSLFIFLIGLIFLQGHFILQHKKKFSLALLIIIISGLIFFKPLWPFINNLNVTRRTISTIEFIRQGHVPDRVSWWFSSLSMIKDRPLLGYGLSTYKDVYNHYRRQDYRLPAEEQDIQVPETAHMEYLNIAATEGLIGLITYLLFIGSFIWLAIRGIKQEKSPHRYLSLGILTAVISYLLQVLMSFGTVSTLFFLYLFMGLGIALLVIRDTLTITSKTYQIRYRKSFFVILFIIITLGFNFSYRYLKAEYLYRLALNYDESALAKADSGAKEEASNLYNQSLNIYHELVNLVPHEYSYLSAMADSAFAAALIQTDFISLQYYLNLAAEMGRKAVTIIADQPHIRANLALTYFALERAYEQNNQPEVAKNYFNKAVKEYEQALLDSPNNPLYVFRFGQIYSLTKQYKQAIPYFLQTMAIRDNYKEAYFELAKAYFYLKDFKEALLNIDKALQFSPNDGQYLEWKEKIANSN